MESAHNGFFLPNLLTFTNGNTFLGSFRGLRFRVKPGTEGEGDEAREVLACLCWYGEYCLEESEVAAEASFPLTAEGREGKRCGLARLLSDSSHGGRWRQVF